MDEITLLAVKALAGGVLVVGFALISEIARPKSFAGLFGPAPAVALAGLSLTVLDKGEHEAAKYAVGMIAGSVAMLAYCLLVVALLRRARARPASVVGLTGWLATAGVLYLVVWQ